MRAVSSLLASVGAALLAGCGTGNDRQQARAVVERFYDALRQDRPGIACRQSAPRPSRSKSGKRCARVIGRLGIRRSPARQPTASRATVPSNAPWRPDRAHMFLVYLFVIVLGLVPSFVVGALGQ